VLEMRVGLSQPDDRIRLQISSSCDDQESSWLASNPNGLRKAGQMRSVKTNESEPLMKGRKTFQTVSKPGFHFDPGSSVGEDLFATGMTPGLKAASVRIRLKHGTLEPVASMQRESHKPGNGEGESTERRAERSSARHRDGTTRSSDEGPVTGLERRGRVIQFLVNRSTPTRRGRNP
jgi:hypothetical protein